MPGEHGSAGGSKRPSTADAVMQSAPPSRIPIPRAKRRGLDAGRPL